MYANNYIAFTIYYYILSSEGNLTIVNGFHDLLSSCTKLKNKRESPVNMINKLGFGIWEKNNVTANGSSLKQFNYKHLCMYIQKNKYTNIQENEERKIKTEINLTP